MTTFLPLTIVVFAVNSVSGLLGLREAIRTIIAEPNIAFCLLFLGLLSIYAEFTLPGRIIPGAVGGVAVLLGLSGLCSLPVTSTGVALLVLSFVCYVLEAKYVTRGLLTALGAALMVVGAMTLVSRSSGVSGVRLSTALTLALPFSAISAFLFSIARKARRNKRLPPLR